MATARVPLEDDVLAQVITIASNGVLSPATCFIANAQQVTFVNNSGGSIPITFEPDAFGVTVFNNVSVGGNGGTNTQSPQVNNRTVNYNTDGSTTYPYAIQVGAGALFIKVTYNQTSGNGDCTPDPAVIPLGGTIEFIGDANYSVRWNAANGDPFTPPLTNIYTASNPLTVPHTASRPSGNYGYTITKLAITDGTGHGGGTIKIGG